MAEVDTQESSTITSLEEPLDRLMAFEPTTLPVISLYLDTQAGQTGRDEFESFVRKEFANRARTYPAGSAERQSFDQDLERIAHWLSNDLKPSANGVALFACSGANLWEALQLNAPLGEHKLYVYHQPHLYHLTRLDDVHPRYAALITDANSARIFVFGLGETLETEQVKGKKVQRVKVGGWSQARYQRRVDNAHSNHAKQVTEALGRIVRDESIQQIVIAGDPQITSLLQEEMPQDLREKVADTVRLDIKASDQEVFQATFEALRKQDAGNDQQKAERALNEFRRGGLGCAGLQPTLEALANGQVDELLLSASLEQSHPEEEPVDAILAPEVPDAGGSTETDEPRQVLVADLLVTKAKQTDATVTFIEDASLLESVDGIAAILRWRS